MKIYRRNRLIRHANPTGMTRALMAIVHDKARTALIISAVLVLVLVLAEKAFQRVLIRGLNRRPQRSRR